MDSKKMWIWIGSIIAGVATLATGSYFAIKGRRNGSSRKESSKRPTNRKRTARKPETAAPAAH